MSDQLIAQWIVENSEKYGINPVECNQGIWYFGPRIAESNFILQKALQDIDYAKEIFKEHIKVLKELGSPEFMDEIIRYY